MTSSGEKTSMSVRWVWTGFSTSVTGLRGSFQTRRARFMTPWSTVRILSFVRLFIRPPAVRPAAQRSTPSVVMSSRRIVAEGGEEVRLDDRVVVAHGRRLAGAVVLDPAQVLGRRVGERRAGADHPGQRAAARLVEQVAQPRLGRALRVEAGGRAPARRPRRPDALLDLAAVRQPVLRVPGVRSRAGQAVHVARRIPDHRPIIAPVGTFPGTHLGTKWGPSSPPIERPENDESPAMQGFSDAGGGTRTPDTRIMIPLL